MYYMDVRLKPHLIDIRGDSLYLYTLAHMCSDTFSAYNVIANTIVHLGTSRLSRIGLLSLTLCTLSPQYP
jgi:hypothetical protein